MTDHAIDLSGHQLAHRTFLLGNEGGFVFYQPVEQGVRDATLLPTKWFGASSFGHQYLSATRVWIVFAGKPIALNRANQTGFSQELHSAVLTFEVDGCTIRQTFFVPDRIDALVMSLHSDPGVLVIAEPEFDMRYYQAFNTDFSAYRADAVSGGWLQVSNHIAGPSVSVPRMEFYAAIGAAQEGMEIELLPEKDRLRRKTYLVDEHREKVIQGAYLETHETSPDEAPIWDQYGTQIYAPARLHGKTPIDLVFAFETQQADAQSAADEVRRSLPSLRRQKQDEATRRLEQGQVETGVVEVDRAYHQVLARFDNCLVARDMTLHVADTEKQTKYNAIFAGNKYFLDAWKRDENISLGALLVTGDYGTVRAILGDTWQYQDSRTGRLPHIIRLGEPLVYYSSDGTLWALRRLFQYTRMTGDRTLLEEKKEMVEHFFRASMNFVQRGLLPSGGIIDATYLWETWEDTAYTPRDGYPVEIELLWLTVLAEYPRLLPECDADLAQECREVLKEGHDSFRLFHLDGYLADSLSYQWEPRTILTPNGYIAFDVGYPLPPELARSMIALGREQLAGQVGIRSLAPRDWAKVLSPEFLADPHRIHTMNMASVGIYNYHRGIEWLWLNQFFVEAELQYGDATHAFERYVRGQVHETLHQGGVSGLSELYDLHGSLGADFQAWSMAGFVVSVHAFAGITLDALEKSVRVRPSIPPHWPGLTCRRQVGETRFDLVYGRESPVGQVIDIRPVDPIPEGYTLHLGVVLPTGHAGAEVTINGQRAPREAVQVRPAVPGMQAEAWVRCPFDGPVTARFSAT